VDRTGWEGKLVDGHDIAGESRTHAAPPSAHPRASAATISLLQESPNLSEEEIRVGLEGNLCRCTGYHNIVRAVQAAARAGV
jgi:hypothetical protein